MSNCRDGYRFFIPYCSFDVRLQGLSRVYILKIVSFRVSFKGYKMHYNTGQMGEWVRDRSRDESH
jgi:hypothetical protein